MWTKDWAKGGLGKSSWANEWSFGATPEIQNLIRSATVNHLLLHPEQLPCKLSCKQLLRLITQQNSYLDVIRAMQVALKFEHKTSKGCTASGTPYEWGIYT